MKKLNNNSVIIKTKCGLKAAINTTTTKALASVGEFHYCTDTEELFIFNGTENVLVGGSTISSADDIDDSTSDNKFISAAELSKLSGIETGATSDQTDAEIKIAYENNANTEAFTTSEKAKLASLEGSKFLGEFASLAALQTAYPSPSIGSYANVDSGSGSDVEKYVWDNSDSEYVKSSQADPLTSAQVKSLYEANADTEAFTSTLKTKLDTIPSDADKTSSSSVKAAIEAFSLTDITGSIQDEDEFLVYDVSNGELKKVPTSTVIGSSIPSVDANPVGMPSLWFTDTAPSDHLILKNQTLLVADYPQLFAVWGDSFGGDGVTTFGTPDVDDRFIRILGDGGGVDAASRTDRGDGTTGDNVGTLQGDEFKSHNHNIYQEGSTGTSGAVGSNARNNSQTRWTSDSGGSETRPKNIYARLVVRYQKSPVANVDIAETINSSSGVIDANKVPRTDVNGKLDESFSAAPIIESLATLTGGSGTEVSSISSVNVFGQRIGKVITLGFTSVFNISTGNNFDYYTIPLSNFAFLSGLTVANISGAFATNINSSSVYGGAVSGYFDLDGSTKLGLGFSGKFYTQTNRSLNGTLTILLS